MPRTCNRRPAPGNRDGPSPRTWTRSIPICAIPLNDRVLAYVELFSGRLKGYLEDGLNRGGRYLPMVRDIFEAEGLPLDLVVRAAD